MTTLHKFAYPVNIPKTTAGQSCVQAVLSSSLPAKMKQEAARFISRNVIPDCGRVAPNCLKAHLISTAKKMGMNDKIQYLNSLFRAKIGFNGYYLDENRLKKV